MIILLRFIANRLRPSKKKMIQVNQQSLLQPALYEDDLWIFIICVNHTFAAPRIINLINIFHMTLLIHKSFHQMRLSYFLESVPYYELIGWLISGHLACYIKKWQSSYGTSLIILHKCISKFCVTYKIQTMLQMLCELLSNVTVLLLLYPWYTLIYIHEKFH